MSEAVAVEGTRSAGLFGPAVARLIALLLPLALLGGALGSQYLGGLHPCEMCYWQRWPHAAAIFFAALAFIAPAESSRSRNFTLAAALAIAISGVIGVYHAGVTDDFAIADQRMKVRVYTELPTPIDDVHLGLSFDLEHRSGEMKDLTRSEDEGRAAAVLSYVM